MYKKFSLHDGLVCMSQDNLVEMYLNNVWRANISVTGQAGLPDMAVAGNVLRQSTEVRLSIRLPPVMDPTVAFKAVHEKLTTNVPHGCKVTCIKNGHGFGWNAKDYEGWFDEAIKNCGAEFFEGKQTQSYGMGGSIPFLAELEKIYPST